VGGRAIHTWECAFKCVRDVRNMRDMRDMLAPMSARESMINTWRMNDGTDGCVRMSDECGRESASSTLIVMVVLSVVWQIRPMGTL
jgi:hypothetical protein